MSASGTLVAKAPRTASGGVWVLLPLLVLAGIFFYPLTLIARQAVTLESGEHSVAPLIELVNSSFFRQALLNTLEIAAASTLGCLVFGFALALVLSFVPFPGGRF